MRTHTATATEPTEATTSVGRLYSSMRATELSGASYRQVDYWVRMKVIEPELPARGSGSSRQWTFEQVAALRVARELADHGCPTRVLAVAVQALLADLGHGWCGPVLVNDDGVFPIGDLSDLRAGWCVNPVDAWAHVRAETGDADSMVA